MIYSNIQQRAQQEVKILGIGKLDGYLLKKLIHIIRVNSRISLFESRTRGK